MERSKRTRGRNRGKRLKRFMFSNFVLIHLFSGFNGRVIPIERHSNGFEKVHIWLEKTTVTISIKLI